MKFNLSTLYCSKVQQYAIHYIKILMIEKAYCMIDQKKIYKNIELTILDSCCISSMLVV